MTSETALTIVPDFDNMLPESAAHIMNQLWNGADDSLPPSTIAMADYCDRWLIVRGVWGPKDLGNGDVYALEVEDEFGVSGILYCGSRQIVQKLAHPALKPYLMNPMLEFDIWFTLHERKDRPYYTCNAWFGPSGSGPVATLKN